MSIRVWVGVKFSSSSSVVVAGNATDVIVIHSHSDSSSVFLGHVKSLANFIVPNTQETELVCTHCFDVLRADSGELFDSEAFTYLTGVEPQDILLTFRLKSW